MDDLISREEAISTIKSMLYQTALNSVNGDEKAAQLYADIADNRVEIWLKLVESVDAAPVVHGRWIYESEGMGDYSHCSECGCRVPGGRISDLSARYKFCPNCGAKMDGERRDGE